MDQQDHNDGCRCLNCCRAKFKKIDPASYGKIPIVDENNPFRPRVCNHVLFDASCEMAPPKE